MSAILVGFVLTVCFFILFGLVIALIALFFKGIELVIAWCQQDYDNTKTLCVAVGSFLLLWTALSWLWWVSGP
jgi:hypothetical protein